ncbi:hypothetical protein MMC28_011493 [Mycoblastus sanguinarius]|nr:hypothetical protein [Mycoblastus sanguinarius]
MPRLVRRQPLIERLKSKLDPYDFLLWISEELDSSWLEQFEKEWALPAGVLINLIFIVARANSKGSRSKGYDDIFGDDDRSYGGGLLSWLASFTVLVLGLASVLNAIYTFQRKRHYRLFEASVDSIPSTPSAHRVRVDSSPISSSPLRFLSSILGAGADDPQSRAHPDATRDVWELGVWDPLPLCLRLFTLFSPGHVLIYLLFLPTVSTDPRPSTTIITSMLVSLLLSLQLHLLHTSFSQQTKDAALIHKEVLHEYDTKYVHPRTQPLYRDASTQFNESASYNPTRDAKYNSVEVGVPMHIINRGFNPNPNPNYNKLIDPDNGQGPQPTPSRRSSPAPTFPQTQPLATPSSLQSLVSSPLKPQTAIRQPQFRPSSRGDGGSLGIYSHAQSPLRKSTSTHFDPRLSASAYSNDYARERASPEKRIGHKDRATSPVKRSSLPPGGGGGLGLVGGGGGAGNVNTLAAAQRWGHLQQQGRGGRRESGRF